MLGYLEDAVVEFDKDLSLNVHQTVHSLGLQLESLGHKHPRN